MIPKIIHYCWFGGKEKSNLVKQCIESWKKYLPEYEIVEWNETNTDLSNSVYIEKAYNEYSALLPYYLKASAEGVELLRQGKIDFEVRPSTKSRGVFVVKLLVFDNYIVEVCIMSTCSKAEALIDREQRAVG